LAGETVSDSVVEKNLIGPAFSGSGALPTGLAPSKLLYGLRVDRAANVRVTENVIAGHEWDVLISGTEQFEEDPDDGEIFLSDPDNPLEISLDLAPVAGALIERNTIGLNSLGAVPLGTDSHSGIAVYGGARGTVIRDNVVAGHAENEVWLSNGSNHVISGNRLGTPDGVDRGSQTGLLLDDTKSVIVGPSGISPGNTIGWNAVAGIHVRGAAIDPLIRLNQIGVDPTAQSAWPNGIGVQAGSAGSAGAATGLRLEKNVIGGNTKAGVGLTLANKTVLQGNRIGVSPIGSALPNETGVAVGGTPVQLLQNTIAHNKTVGIAILGEEPAMIQGGPIYANGTGLSFEGILYNTPPIPPSAPPVILRSTAGDSGKVTVVYVVAAPGGVGEVEIEIYGNRALESQGRTPLLRRTTPAEQALIGKLEVEPGSAFAVLETFSVTVTRDGRTSEFSKVSPGLSFELSKPQLVAVSDTELTMQWSGSPLIFPEQADSPNGPWEPVTAQPVIGADGTAVLTLPTEAGTKFFRLRLNL
ncbi:MAG: right-handed parallel beta-helix repeat-containing protein, partial [Verrucomicrobia bacterium]|nr:right-handed parallel beta-helix repeat-containing protein [Verrucomicrobiota bacterium]